MTFDRRSKRQRESTDPVVRYLGELQAGVMGVFWLRESATIHEVGEDLKERGLAYSTVLTVVTRLYGRGLLKREREGRSHRYRAAKTRDEFLGELSDKLIDQVLNDFGEVGVARLGERLETLDPERLERLRLQRTART